MGAPRAAIERGFRTSSAANADLVVDGAGAVDWKVERVIAEMRQRGLLTGAR